MSKGVAGEQEVVLPIGGIGQRFDNDSPDYVFSPDIYLVLALSYDSMAGPEANVDADGVISPDFTRMRPRLAVDWHEEESGDWVVELRPGQVSHAGNELTADDLVWGFDKAVAQGVMAAWRFGRNWRGAGRGDRSAPGALLPAGAVRDVPQLAAVRITEQRRLD